VETKIAFAGERGVEAAAVQVVGEAEFTCEPQAPSPYIAFRAYLLFHDPPEHRLCLSVLGWFTSHRLVADKLTYPRLEVWN
jgi:hypothetical protein